WLDTCFSVLLSSPLSLTYELPEFFLAEAIILSTLYAFLYEMGSRERPFFDLNELPAEENEEAIDASCFQPQRAMPSSNRHTTEMFAASAGPQKTMRAVDLGSEVASLSKIAVGEDKMQSPLVDLGSMEIRAVEKEEGEWSDAEGSGMDMEAVTGIKDENNDLSSLGLDPDTNNRKSSNSQNPEGNCKGDMSMDGQEELGFVPKQREVKGTEASHALKCANNSGKRPRFDQQKEVMLGKKRNRQTMFLKLDDIKQAGPIKTSTPRRQTFPAPVTIRTVKESRNIPPPAERNGEKQSHPMNKDPKQVDLSCSEGNTFAESNDSIMNISWKQPTDSRQLKNAQVSSRKPALISQGSTDAKLGTKKLPSKKQTTVSTPYQDTSVERLLREVTSENFWHHPDIIVIVYVLYVYPGLSGPTKQGILELHVVDPILQEILLGNNICEAELQCVPGQFDSVEEYIRVFEPLLFEECRAQLYSTWEELTETVSRDLHTVVRVRSVERRERGWYDVIVLPANECKWTFKEGEVAVLSTPKPGTVRSKRSSNSDIADNEEPEVSGRVAGTVRRYMPPDTRDPPGAILHFYVGDSYDPNSQVDNDHIIRKLQLRGIWFLTVLGTLATIQREYIALHAFRRLNLQMQMAILQPSAEHFPKYEEQPPAMHESFTPNFFDYLRRTFNVPQLAAIQWAAMHTAAGTSSGKKQDPWPFTLVQGPPGTGKTHTVWGMLNVIHLVQYQHYYAALLKKLAPESYKQTTDVSSDNVVTGSIDEVLQSMDQNLFRTLPKLCPKPRMLVCAPSNAATDELLTRAVSVERRTEQLLVKSRDEVYGWMHQLRGREAQLGQQIACLQRELNVAAAAGHAQGSCENRDKVLVEMSRLLILEGKFRANGNFNLEEARANLEASFANEAEIVFTTVSSSGRRLFSRLTHGFDMVVIDEAAQASEVAILPPLALGAARCVLVGDPQQLPATVISKAAGTLLYSRSLFERFQQAGCPTMLLSVQYRMHPQIRDFPSRYFYQGRLTDSESVANLPEEIYYKDSLLRPYVFYDITHGRESQRGGSVSYQNIHEAQFCLRLYEHLQRTLKSLTGGKVTVGIITPYKLQLKCLQREFEGVLNSEEGKDIYINTVDAFQGQERDVIIMSCVRASNHGVGFVADIRRMNVALTRARRALWVMGNANSLMKSDDWAALITDAKARNCYLDMDSLPKDFILPKSLLWHHHLSGTPSEDDEKLNAPLILKNGNYRPSKPPMGNSSEDLDLTSEKSRDAWQYGIPRGKIQLGLPGREICSNQLMPENCLCAFCELHNVITVRFLFANGS
ncbi:hypothetical protein C3L33_00037, partial [Rhododendron williamsianum]